MAQRTPIVLNQDKTQHIPLADGDTISVSGIPLSPDSGNQIQARDNGLYYGQVAPADISNLYVSNQGSDSNSGTVDNPLQTVDRAISMIQERDVGGSYTIRLKAGQTFAMEKYTYAGDTTKQINIQYYDDPTFGEATGGNGYWVVTAAALKKPVMVFNTEVAEDGFAHRICPGISLTSVMTFVGVDIIMKQDAGRDVGGASFLYGATFDFQGSKLTLESEDVTLGSATSILLRHCDFENKTANGHLFVGDYAPQLFEQTLHTPGQTYKDPAGKLPDLVARDTNMKTTLKASDAVALATYDAATKTMFGWGANWDIFANG